MYMKAVYQGSKSVVLTAQYQLEAMTRLDSVVF